MHLENIWNEHHWKQLPLIHNEAFTLADLTRVNIQFMRLCCAVSPMCTAYCIYDTMATHAGSILLCLGQRAVILMANASWPVRIIPARPTDSVSWNALSSLPPVFITSDSSGQQTRTILACKECSIARLLPVKSLESWKRNTHICSFLRGIFLKMSLKIPSTSNGKALLGSETVSNLVSKL